MASRRDPVMRLHSSGMHRHTGRLTIALSNGSYAIDRRRRATIFVSDNEPSNDQVSTLVQ